MNDTPMTSGNGAPLADNQNSETAGARGPVTIQDFWLIEKNAHFNREVIPERRVHAKGSAAFGTLTITHDISRYTKADIFSTIGKQTELLLRFSTVAGERGAADTERDVRGFALKFYTQQGNWDLVGNNTPVFFIRDPLKFPDFIHTQKRDPRTNLRSNTHAWDFWSLHPESLHQVTILMSDRGIPANLRHQHGFGSHTYSFVNAANERYWVKFHFKSMQGIKNLTDAEGADVIAGDREASQRDLFNAIENGNFPRWRMAVQIMAEADAATYHINPFDLTKVWPHGHYPLIDVGVLELNRNPDNYFSEVEQSAFSPANVVPGIGYSPDKMLQGRLFAYADAHRYRLGVNADLLPVNRPICPVRTSHRDGLMRFDHNGGTDKNYQPNSFDGQKDNPSLAPPALHEAFTGIIDRHDHRVDDDYYSQPGNLFRLFNDDEKQRLFANIGRHMAEVPEFIQRRQIEHFSKADPAYGAGVAKALGLAI